MRGQERGLDNPGKGIGTPKYFGRMLTTVRRAYVGPKFEEYADKLGMKPLAYTNWESGRNGMPTSDQIQDWGRKLGCDEEVWDEMYFGAGFVLPKDRADESKRKLDLIVYRMKFENGPNPLDALFEDKKGITEQIALGAAFISSVVSDLLRKKR
jgi:transcriptional regulator with XRE-family HTH domain